VALSLAQRTDEAAVAALGADIRHYPVALPDPAYVGVASMVVQGRPGFTRVRTPYVSDADVAAICTSTAGLTRDPSSLRAEAPRLAHVVPWLRPDRPGGGRRQKRRAWPGRDDQDAEDAA
jgi:DNA segregation ATPase FtsK/SpoIIIE, S-DNA-T family